MFKKTINPDEVANMVLTGFGQLAQSEDVNKLILRSLEISNKTALMFGIEHVCFWLYILYADIKANHPKDADRFMHEVIKKAVEALNKTGDEGFLDLATLKPEVVEKYFYDSWIHPDTKIVNWMNNNHKLLQLEQFNNESWLGQLTLLLCAHIAPLFFDNKEKIDNLYEWLPIYQSCSSTSIAYGKLFIGHFKKYKLSLK